MMEKLGYQFNGQYLQRRGDDCVRDRRMRLPRESWQSDRHADMTIRGLPPCLELFGLSPAQPRTFSPPPRLAR